MTLAYGILAALALAIGAFFYGDHVGALASKTALEGFQAAQSANTAKAVLAERASGAAELARVNTILKGYQDAPVDPVVTTIAHRVYVYAANASGCPVSSAGSVAGGTSPSATITSGPGRVEQALGSYVAACDADSKQLEALIKLAPNP